MLHLYTGFVELQQRYYRNGTYLSKPIFCNINEIATVTEANDSYANYRTVLMKSGTRYDVNDSYDDIISKIVQASAMEDDGK